MKRCHCPACRARLDRDYWRLIDANYNRAERTIIEAQAVADTIGATVVARCNQYGRRPNERLRLPPIPRWRGDPRELDL